MGATSDTYGDDWGGGAGGNGSIGLGAPSNGGRKSPPTSIRGFYSFNAELDSEMRNQALRAYYSSRITGIAAGDPFDTLLSFLPWYQGAEKAAKMHELTGMATEIIDAGYRNCDYTDQGMGRWETIAKGMKSGTVGTYNVECAEENSGHTIMEAFDKGVQSVYGVSPMNPVDTK